LRIAAPGGHVAAPPDWHASGRAPVSSLDTSLRKWRCTSSILQTEDDGWKCFGSDNTVIPHIIDLRDTTTLTSVKVALGPLNAAQIELFQGRMPSSSSAESSSAVSRYTR
jgi:hypothetical protein